jgi:hypothetical protein
MLDEQKINQEKLLKEIRGKGLNQGHHQFPFHFTWTCFGTWNRNL